METLQRKEGADRPAPGIQCQCQCQCLCLCLCLCIVSLTQACRGPQIREAAQAGGGASSSDADADDDGIINRQDRCPQKPEDRDDFEDEDGCPDLDNDRDRIPDACDKCPNEPEDVDCPVGDGCPGSHCRGSCVGESAYNQWRVAVLFKRAEATPGPSADEVLARVAKKMRDPGANLFICSQCVRGPAKALFLRRVRSVRDDLRGRGVSSSRVDARLHCLQRAPAADSLDLYLITISAPASR